VDFNVAINSAIFGSKTCFEITFMGGKVFKYSKFKREAEVLIPPYEVFKVTSVETKAKKSDLECDVVYKIKSTGQPVSNNDCALSTKQKTQLCCSNCAVDKTCNI